MSFLLWPIIAVWMGLGLVVGLGAIVLLAWAGAHIARDAFIGSDGDIYCPVHQATYQGHGTPRGFRSPVPFVTLTRCSFFADGKVTCSRKCLSAALPS